MALEEQRYLHEDLERLEQGIANRISDEPKHIRDRLNRDHEIAQLLDQIQVQSQNLLNIYRDTDGSLATEIHDIGTDDSFDKFYAQLKGIRDHHAKYPNEQAQNSELRYRTKRAGDSAEFGASIVDTLFSGEEGFGRFFDLSSSHEQYLNLPNVKRHTYVQYLDLFSTFSTGMGGVKRVEKLTDQYFQYVRQLAAYLESFMRRTRPLENVDKTIESFDKEFEEAWEKDQVEGWTAEPATNSVHNATTSVADIFCDDCDKGFSNQNVYNAHLTGRKHTKAAEARAKRQAEQAKEEAMAAGNNTNGNAVSATRLKEKVVAHREFLVKRLTASMSTERSDTRVNVERKQGMTERERRQELESIFNADVEPEPAMSNADGEENDDGDDDSLYNPLKLPLAWDGKPIPFWLYRLHGLGVEFPCEICGNFVYMGRRAFDKHFNESRHVYGLRCLGITNTSLFRDIVHIEEATKLWEKMEWEKKKNKVDENSMVQMEDGNGNVMPEKVYYDLQKQGLL
ncbi:Pre-mRNA-splicing factor sap61 [Ceratocystis pirilliformis]|uniref:Pre-mRNA-splicing factor sap61 n=1 Tax=Ceratocystis pirilliformis TaxID=259994 RepID=A0ABR3ZNH5_9PEZI